MDCNDTCVGDDALIGNACDSTVDADNCATGLFECSSGTLLCDDDEPLDDADADGVWDCNDDCPGTAPADPVGNTGCSCAQLGPTRAVVDTDSDGVPDVCDNCPNGANFDQTDTDGDELDPKGVSQGLQYQRG